MKKYQKYITQLKNQALSNKQTVKFQSGMTFQQRFQSIAQSVLSNITIKAPVQKGCEMHPKISKKCRKCIQIQKQSNQIIQKQQQFELDQSFPQIIKLNTNDMKSHFISKLQTNIEDSTIYRNKIKNITNVKDLANNLTSDQISISAFINSSNDVPTQFICHLYRLAQLKPTKQQILIMLRANNVNIRCLVLLYLRVYTDPSIVYGCLRGSFKDKKLLNINTIGQYAMRLFNQQQLNHGGFRLPRLPLKIQKAIQKKIKLLQQQRQKIFQKQRSRSRQRHRKRQQSIQNKERSKSSSSSSSQCLSKQKVILPQQIKQQLSLKQKIRLMQQKKQQTQKRNKLINSYKQETINFQQSQEQAYDQNDDIQKIKLGQQ